MDTRPQPKPFNDDKPDLYYDTEGRFGKSEARPSLAPHYGNIIVPVPEVERLLKQLKD